MKGHGAKFPNRFTRTIATLLEHGSWKKAANAAGVAESTLWRWSQTEEFKKVYREAKERIIAEAVSRLQKASGEAVTTLRIIMLDREKSTNARVTAARAILDLSFKSLEMDNFVERIENLERLSESEKGEI
jgi:hypothetical protein